MNCRDLPDPGVIVAAALHLMTHHATTHCPYKARLVVQQLEFLANYPSDAVSPMLRQVCRKLIVEWYGLIYEMHKVERSSTATPLLQ
ncbi:MAG: hypothetical protein HYU77_08165 [Betaproteobacteria bacterium]|nr:hypothetical protein [Betaproteobacteria bacterium]